MEARTVIHPRHRYVSPGSILNEGLLMWLAMDRFNAPHWAFVWFWIVMPLLWLTALFMWKVQIVRQPLWGDVEA